ncbi:hypothetical protein ACIF6K_20880 [Streptomyces sp. NPDC085942]|uniref:hypothetical protein n=1 Tax=Streptomyces sp. NPDC085942 TaxID=3365743 RepID=UPI0037D30B12
MHPLHPRIDLSENIVEQAVSTLSGTLHIHFFTPKPGTSHEQGSRQKGDDNRSNTEHQRDPSA